jgi:RNA polymerase sigma-70 factor (ECF subfamily)
MSEPSTIDGTSTSLLERVRRSDAQAWKTLCRLYAPLVYGWARQAGLQDADAADVGQEVFRTVAARIDTFHRIREGSLRAWLWKITKNKLGDYIRCAQARPPTRGGSSAYQQLQQLSAAPPEESTDSRREKSQSNILHLGLQAIQNEVEPQTWLAFWRSTVDGHATVDIAGDLGMTTNAVRQAKFRVLRRLRCELDGLLE